MRLFAFDLETALIGDSLRAPLPVCVSWASVEVDPSDSEGLKALLGRLKDTCREIKGGGRPTLPEISFGLEYPEEGFRKILEALSDTDTTLCGHNLWFDMPVVLEEEPSAEPLVLAAIEDGRAICTMLREQLIDIALGEFRGREVEDADTGETSWQNIRYNLGDCASKRLGLQLDKGEDTYRTHYSALARTPIAEWPAEARDYALFDAVVDLTLLVSQMAESEPPTDEIRQNKAGYALARISARGFCVDPEAVEKLYTELAIEVNKITKELEPFLIYRADGSKNMAQIKGRVIRAFEDMDKEIPTTETKDIATDRQTLLDSCDPVLSKLAGIGEKHKILNTFIPVLRRGYQSPIVCSYNALVYTGRTSAFGPNLQQPPRFPGVRDCFVPREGFWLASVDYNSLELRTLAQACFSLLGWSTLQEKYQQDPAFDPHSDFSAEVLGVSYAEFLNTLADRNDPRFKEFKDHRQRSKACNFGLPGGLGDEKLQRYAKAQYKVEMTLQECSQRRRAWKRKWPEVPEYQRQVSDALLPPNKKAAFELVQTGFKRGGCGYTDGCNFQFQGLAAAGAKEACWRVAVDGPANNVFPVAFLHDEILAEVPIECATESAEWLCETMIEAMESVVPDVPIAAGPALMRRWYKDAEEVRDSQGKLVPWEPKQKA